jgi:hypothetical protein
MGCCNSRQATLLELEYLKNQMKKENDQLEKERDLLKSQHEDRPDEEKELVNDLQVMHYDLESELKELKDLMTEFLLIPEAKDHTFVTIKSIVERVTSIQAELEEQTERFRDMVCKRKDLQKEHKNLEMKIIQAEVQITELKSACSKHEWTLKEKGGFDDNKQREFERQKTRIIENLKNDNPGCETEPKDEIVLIEEKQELDTLVSLSEIEIAKEIKELENELEIIAEQVKEQDLNESEIQQMANYIRSLQNKLKITEKNANFREQIVLSEEKIRELKKEKKELKAEMLGLKKTNTSASVDIYSKIMVLNDMLNATSVYSEFKFKTCNDSLIMDVEETLRKAKTTGKKRK